MQAVHTKGCVDLQLLDKYQRNGANNDPNNLISLSYKALNQHFLSINDQGKLHTDIIQGEKWCHLLLTGWKIKHICQPKTILGRTLITDMENMKIYLQGEKASPVVKNINVLYLLDPGRMHKLGILKWMWKKCTCLPTTAMHFLLQITDSTDFKNISFWQSLTSFVTAEKKQCCRRFFLSSVSEVKQLK